MKIMRPICFQSIPIPVSADYTSVEDDDVFSVYSDLSEASEMVSFFTAYNLFKINTLPRFLNLESFAQILLLLVTPQLASFCNFCSHVLPKQSPCFGQFSSPYMV